MRARGAPRTCSASASQSSARACQSLAAGAVSWFQYASRSNAATAAQLRSSAALAALGGAGATSSPPQPGGRARLMPAAGVGFACFRGGWAAGLARGLAARSHPLSAAPHAASSTQVTTAHPAAAARAVAPPACRPRCCLALRVWAGHADFGRAAVASGAAACKHVRGRCAPATVRKQSVRVCWTRAAPTALAPTTSGFGMEEFIHLAAARVAGADGEPVHCPGRLEACLDRESPAHACLVRMVTTSGRHVADTAPDAASRCNTVTV